MARRKNENPYDNDYDMPLTEYSRKQREKEKDARKKEQRKEKESRKMTSYSKCSLDI